MFKLLSFLTFIFAFFVVEIIFLIHFALSVKPMRYALIVTKCN